MTNPAVSNLWTICRKPNPQARLRLFCLPYAGGNPWMFRTWSDGLPVDVEVHAIQLPGRGTRLKEPAFARLAPLVQALTQGLLPLLDKPFAFFGHSLGAVVSFELARRLRKQQWPEPVRMFVSACSAPQLLYHGPIRHTLTEVDFLEELRRLNGTPRAVLENAELMELLLPVLRADFAVYETYQYLPEPPLHCPIAVFGGLQDSGVRRGDLEAWRAQTRAACTLRMLPGDHFYLHSAEALLLDALHQELAQNR
jgi:medium-chain acyl-[acyl-carrier-protein] hydrolase